MRFIIRFLKKYFLLFVAGVIAWSLGFIMFSVGIVHDTPENINQKINAIVVLTGGQNRVETGLALLADGKAETLFISGVHPDVKKREIIAKWTGDKPLPACCLVLGQKATNTIENAAEVKEWVNANDVTSILLVTSNYHMPRALIELKDAMPDVFIVKRPAAQEHFDITDQRTLKLLVSEYHKSILRWVQLKVT